MVVMSLCYMIVEIFSIYEKIILSKPSLFGDSLQTTETLSGPLIGHSSQGPFKWTNDMSRLFIESH